MSLDIYVEGRRERAIGNADRSFSQRLRRAGASARKCRPEVGAVPAFGPVCTGCGMIGAELARAVRHRH